MSIVLYRDVECDECGAEARVDELTAKDARATAASKGWQKTGARDVCPDCRHGPVEPTVGYVRARVGRPVRVVRRGKRDYEGRLIWVTPPASPARTQIGVARTAEARCHYIDVETIRELWVTG